MALSLTQITGTVDTPTGETPRNGKVEFRLRDWDKDGNNLFVPGPVVADISVGGTISVYLQTSSTLDRGMIYDVTLTYWSDMRGLLVVPLPSIAVPLTGPVTLASLIATPATIPDAPDLLTLAAGYAAGAQAADVSASASAMASAVSAASAALYDGIWLNDLAAVAADTVLSYTAGAGKTLVTPGMQVQTRSGPSYTVAASGATTYANITSGGVKLNASGWFVTPRMFRAAGNGIADDVLAVQAAWNHAGANRVLCFMEGLEYNCSNSVSTCSNLTVIGGGAVMYITAWPATGGFVSNIVPGDPVARVQSNIRISDLITDGSKLPAPSAVQNTNLGPEFGRGASNVRIVNCTARYIRRGFGSGSGGAGFGGEQGLQNVIFDGCIAENCFRGVRIAGMPGTHADAAAQNKNSIGVVFRELTVKNCNTAIFCHSVGASGDDQSDLSVFDAVFDGTYIEDCGHAAWSDLDYTTYPTMVPQKSGVITIAGAQNIRMRGIRIKINADYTTRADWLGRSGYPSAGTNYTGAGLSGRIGALVWGWGRNITIEDLVLDGTADCARRIARCVALGEIISGAPGNSATSPNEQIDIRITHVQGGAMANVVDGWRSSGGVGLDTAYTSEVVTFTTYAAPTAGVISTGSIPSGGLSGVTSLVVCFQTFRGGVNFGTAEQWIADTATTGLSDFVRKGGLDLGGGYSSSGAKSGLSYDAPAGILRSSQGSTAVKTHSAFYNPNGLVGSITTTASTTTFNTSSDARLKTDFRPFDGLSIIQKIGVYDFAWRSGGRSVGVIAQQLVDMVPDAVNIGDDADIWNSLSADERSPWQVDYSKLVPHLIRSVQQLSMRIDNLEHSNG